MFGSVPFGTAAVPSGKSSSTFLLPPPTKKEKGLTEPLPDYARHLWDHHSVLVTPQVTLRNCHGQGGGMFTKLWDAAVWKSLMSCT